MAMVLPVSEMPGPSLRGPSMAMVLIAEGVGGAKYLLPHTNALRGDTTLPTIDDRYYPQENILICSSFTVLLDFSIRIKIAKH